MDLFTLSNQLHSRLEICTNLVVVSCSWVKKVPRPTEVKGRIRKELTLFSGDHNTKVTLEQESVTYKHAETDLIALI